MLSTAPVFCVVPALGKGGLRPFLVALQSSAGSGGPAGWLGEEQFLLLSLSSLIQQCGANQAGLKMGSVSLLKDWNV